MSEPKSQKIILGLVGALAIAVAAIAFLLGRESARPEPAAAVATAVVPKEEVPSAPPGDTPNPEPKPEAEPASKTEIVLADPSDPNSPRLERDGRGQITISNTNAAPSGPAEKPAAKDAGDVDAYFSRMKQISSGDFVSDPNAFAMELAQAAAKGDTSGFDRLIKDSQNIEREARQVEPPAACRSYHQTSLELLAESRKLLEEMRDAIKNKNMGSLTSMTSKAQALQERAMALEAEEKRIRASS